jgi:hypothetical protein
MALKYLKIQDYCKQYSDKLIYAIFGLEICTKLEDKKFVRKVLRRKDS